MQFIYIDYNKSSFKLDNEEVLTIWYDEYCEAQEVYMSGSDISLSSAVANSFYVMAGGALVKLGDLLKAGEKHIELCRKEDEQDEKNYSDHIRTYGATDYSAR